MIGLRGGCSMSAIGVGLDGGCPISAIRHVNCPWGRRRGWVSLGPLGARAAGQEVERAVSVPSVVAHRHRSGLWL